jgi:hypothetical protein
LINQKFSFFAPLEKYDPINEPDSMGEELVKLAIAPYSQQQTEITW